MFTLLHHTSSRTCSPCYITRRREHIHPATTSHVVENTFTLLQHHTSSRTYSPCYNITRRREHIHPATTSPATTDLSLLARQLRPHRQGEKTTQRVLKLALNCTDPVITRWYRNQNTGMCFVYNTTVRPTITRYLRQHGSVLCLQYNGQTHHYSLSKTARECALFTVQRSDPSLLVI